MNRRGFLGALVAAPLAAVNATRPPRVFRLNPREVTTFSWRWELEPSRLIVYDTPWTYDEIVTVEEVDW